MKTSMRSLLALAMMSGMWSCQKATIETTTGEEAIRSPRQLASGNTGKLNTFYGPQVEVGHGNMRSWVTLNGAGEPVGLGIEMTAASLHGLSQDHMDHMGNTFVLPLHLKARQTTPFDHITVNWEPAGHEPDGVYTLPHFDCHFYMIPVEEQMAIPPYEGNEALFDNYPAPGYIPYQVIPNPPFSFPYLPIPGGVPGMGKHWVNLTSPELAPVNPAVFTHTFIYGSFNGKVTFYEPMITHATLTSKATIHQPIIPATLFNPTGTYYPSEYNIWFDDRHDRHYVSLAGFNMK